MLVLQQQGRHHTHYSSSVVSHGMGDTVHQSEVGTSIDQCVMMLAYPLSELLGEGEKVRVNLTVG